MTMEDVERFLDEVRGFFGKETRGDDGMKQCPDCGDTALEEFFTLHRLFVLGFLTAKKTVVPIKAKVVSMKMYNKFLKLPMSSWRES